MQPSGIDHGACTPALTFPPRVFADGTTHLPVAVLLQCDHRRAVPDDSTGPFGGEGQQQIQPSIVELSIAVGHAPADVVAKLGQGNP